MNESRTTSTAKRFILGKLVATPGALDELKRHGKGAGEFLARHARGDWGDLDNEDKQLNDDAIVHEGAVERQNRILTAYRLNNGEKIWIITEADRSSTCVLLPNEY